MNSGNMWVRPLVIYFIQGLNPLPGLHLCDTPPFGFACRGFDFLYSGLSPWPEPHDMNCIWMLDMALSGKRVFSESDSNFSFFIPLFYGKYIYWNRIE